MLGRLSLKEDWPIFVIPALFHLSDLCFVLIGGFFDILWIELAFSALHLGLLALVWRRGRALATGA
jgi:hypothetical protein